MVRKNASSIGERIFAATTINKRKTASPMISMERLTVKGSVCTVLRYCCNSHANLPTFNLTGILRIYANIVLSSNFIFIIWHNCMFL